MLRSAWILGVGSLLTLWYAGRVLFLSFSRNPEALCRSCDSVARRWSQAILKLAGVSVRVEGVANLGLDGAFIESMTRAGLQIKEQGLNMVFFAEGTRCPDGTLHPFKKGPFVMAIEGGVPVVPVGLVGSRAIMPKGSIRIRRGAIVVRVGEPISVVGMEHADRDGLRDRAWDAVAQLRAEKDGPAAYRANRHWTMFRSHRG